MKEYMKIAIEQAKKSLREGNHGFGAIIVRENEVIAAAYDTEETENDSTAHAEMNVIKKASKKVGKNLKDCVLITTHEPCPMCATAVVWAKIKKIVYGYSIDDAIKQDRGRINIPCKEIFERSNNKIEIVKGVLKEECALLYNKEIRTEIKKLRNVTTEQLKNYNEESKLKRLEWFQTCISEEIKYSEDPKKTAYKLLLKRFNILENEAPIVESSQEKIIFHSKNFCPTLEACKILELDTKNICKLYNEQSTDALIKQIDNSLRFTRNYDKLRPNSNYCEEMIIVDK